MIETYHYAGFSVQTAIANEQCDRNAADELIRSRKTPRYCGAEKTSLWRMPKIEDCLAEGSQFELTGDFVSGRGGGAWLCLPKTLSGMTRGWAYDSEAADGRVFDSVAARYPVAVHEASAA
jgi:hypothetical protein